MGRPFLSLSFTCYLCSLLGRDSVCLLAIITTSDTSPRTQVFWSWHFGKDSPQRIRPGVLRSFIVPSWPDRLYLAPQTHTSSMLRHIFPPFIFHLFSLPDILPLISPPVFLSHFPHFLIRQSFALINSLIFLRLWGDQWSLANLFGKRARVRVGRNPAELHVSRGV